jgi:predicted alpha/beta superfamily hydrolase
MKKGITVIIVVILTALLSIGVTMIIVDSSGLPDEFIIHEVNSLNLNEEREVIVKLPQTYNDSINKHYDVIYVIGGSGFTFNVSYDIELLTRLEYLPELIVVGLPNINHKSRQRDLTPPGMKQDIVEENSPLGKADIYLKYLENEVVTFIDKNYRTTNNRTAIGHSREGLLVMYSLIRKPNLFNARMALSPVLWRENNIFVTNLKDYLVTNDSLNTYLYLCMGQNEVQKMKSAFDIATEILEETEINGFHWTSEYIANATHQNNHILSAPKGIKYYYDKQKK